MEDNYSIDEILSAVDDLQNFKRNKTKKVSKETFQMLKLIILIFQKIP